MEFDMDFRPSSYWAEIEAVEPFRGTGSGPGTAPGFGGGTWLPDADEDEVEIARVSLESTLGDDYSVRAKRTAAGIEHSVVDDYDTDFRVKDPVRQKPLALAELIELIDTVYDVDNQETGLTDRFREMNYGGDEPEELVGFVWVRSAFYPQLGDYYEMRAQEWVAAKRREQGGAAETDTE